LFVCGTSFFTSANSFDDSLGGLTRQRIEQFWWETTIAGLNSTILLSSNHRTSLVIFEWDSCISERHNCQFGLSTSVSQMDGHTYLTSLVFYLTDADANYQCSTPCTRIFPIQH
jgi:hypothetical protein